MTKKVTSILVMITFLFVPFYLDAQDEVKFSHEIELNLINRVGDKDTIDFYKLYFPKFYSLQFIVGQKEENDQFLEIETLGNDTTIFLKLNQSNYNNFVVDRIKKDIDESSTPNENPTKKTEDSQERGFLFITDQDRFAPKGNEDRDYTMGASFLWYWNNKENAYSRGKGIAIRWISKNWLKDSILNFSHGFGVSDSNFTPFRIDSTKVDSTDRPYAAIFSANLVSNYTSSFKSKIPWYQNKLIYASNLHLGTVGRSAARIGLFVQTAIHSGQLALDETAQDSANTRPNPMGWDLAIGNGKNQFVWNYNFSLRNSNTLILSQKTNPALKLEIHPLVGASFGSVYRNIEFGGGFEFGFFKKNYSSESIDNSNFAFDLVSGKKGKEKAKNRIENGKKNIEISLIGGVRWYRWYHNTLLQGFDVDRDKNLKNDISPYVVSEINNFNKITEIGFRVGISNSFNLGYLSTIRGPVLDDNFKQRLHRYGRVFLDLTLD